jgi:hypothetical protein
MGKLGWQFFKYNFPMTKRRGCHYLVWFKDGRFNWSYDKFKSEYDWPDGSKTYINRNYERIRQSAEPLILIVEGYPVNVRLGSLLPSYEVSKTMNNLLKLTYSTGKVAEQIGEKKGLLNDRTLTIVAVIFGGISLLILVGIYMNLQPLADLKPLLKTIQEGINALISQRGI